MDNYIKSLKEELKDIEAKISELENRRKIIEKELIDKNTDFLSKFDVWYKSKSKVHKGWIIVGKTYPVLRSIIDKMDMDRHRTYTIDDIIGEEGMYCFCNYNTAKYEEEAAFFDKMILKYAPAIDEAMRTNLGSFDCDW